MYSTNQFRYSSSNSYSADIIQQKNVLMNKNLLLLRVWYHRYIIKAKWLMNYMIKTKITPLVTISAIGLMFGLLITQTSVPPANASTNDVSMQNNMSPEQLQGILDSVGIDLNLDSLPLSTPQGDLDTGGQMLSQQPSESDDVGGTEEQVSEEEQSKSVDTQDEREESEHEQDQDE